MPSSHDVFISYSRTDKSFVDFLAGTLEDAGLTCFLDTAGLKVFDKLDASLKGAIAESRWLVAIISPSYLKSYWCLFEAIEAIQGQDLSQRFLPVVVRYSPDDQSLDEQFVLKALADLDDQVNEFERQMVRLKAYELATKLDKLQFVRSNLPRVFRQIHERIFPEFSLWDDRAVRDSLRQVVHRLAPEAELDLSAVPLEYKMLSATPVVTPRIRELPSIQWKVEVGRMARKNSPVVVGNSVLVASAGTDWNRPDERDGIYCLDADTGEQMWFARTPADANHLLASKGVVVTGCDDGTVFAVTIEEGHKLWETRLEGGVVGGPVKLSANIGAPLGDQQRETLDPILVSCFPGSVHLLDLTTGRVIAKLAAASDTEVVSDLGMFDWQHEQFAVLPTRDGRMLFVGYDDIRLTLQEMGGYQLSYPSRFAPDGHFPAALACPPVLTGDLLMQGFVRDTYYDTPPLMALDLTTKNVKWLASDPEKLGEGFGNLRGPPVVVDGEAVFCTAYSNKLCAISIDDGVVRWAVDVGQGMFEQWCAPVRRGRSVYIGRQDGYLHKVDVSQRRREWSIYLGSAARAGSAIASDQEPPEFGARPAWISGASSPILAMPAIDGGRLYCGTHEGWMYCVTGLGEDLDVD